MARKLGEPLVVAPVRFSMIAILSRIGERCKSSLHAVRLLTRVLFVALRGLYRSWRAQDPTAHPAFRRARHAAYRQLWAKLENVYWKLRGRNSDAPTLRALLRDVNAFLADNFLYIREVDQVLLSQYILSLRRLIATSYPVNENEAAEVWQTSGPPAPGSFANSDLVTAEVVELRNRVLQKMRRALPAG